MRDSTAELGILLQTVYLRLEIEERDRPVGGRPRGDAGHIHHHRQVCRASHDATPFGGFGGAIYGNDFEDHAIGASTPSLIRGP